MERWRTLKDTRPDQRHEETRFALLDHLALDDLIDALGPEDFAQVVEVFLADMPDLLRQMEHATAAGDWQVTFAVAREAEATAETLGLPRLTRAMSLIKAVAGGGSTANLSILLENARRVWTESAYALDLLQQE
jgi:HPt (histidine-containing phosphotransfer) domain-containing protein